MFFIIPTSLWWQIRFPGYFCLKSAFCVVGECAIKMVNQRNLSYSKAYTVARDFILLTMFNFTSRSSNGVGKSGHRDETRISSKKFIGDMFFAIRSVFLNHCYFFFRATSKYISALLNYCKHTWNRLKLFCIGLAKQKKVYNVEDSKQRAPCEDLLYIYTQT